MAPLLAHRWGDFSQRSSRNVFGGEAYNPWAAALTGAIVGGLVFPFILPFILMIVAQL